MRITVNFNAKIIPWAIIRAGHNLHEFTSIHPEYKAWMEGTKNPTVKQLEAFAKKVHIPYGYLFLDQPPREKIPFPFFRNNKADTSFINVNVYDTIHILQRRQEWLSNYLRENGFQRLGFAGSVTIKSSVNTVVASIRKQIGLNENWAAGFTSWEEALKHLVGCIEEAGIIVVFNGVVENNNTRTIEVDECRGFVLTDEYAPFLFINNSDSRAAQMFTLIHELAHIWTGHSAGFDNDKMLPANDPVEKFCDAVAAEFLVPEKTFIHYWKETPDIRKASRHFKVSEIVIARRALDSRVITKKDFLAFYHEYKSRELKKKEDQSPGGDFYATTRKRISPTFAAHIQNAVKSGRLLYRDAYKLTGLKGDTFEKFFEKLT
ncbi:MAG: ImmA/IrrE family metallo-endopeptidase [Bacteroidia bacterium]|jgi:Zn-dependent peptidase ImmA (M78 family)|nr:ImmA/IrrE family metallo-endopeptidase [Bacteroidia bacterium]